MTQKTDTTAEGLKSIQLLELHDLYTTYRSEVFLNSLLIETPATVQLINDINGLIKQRLWYTGNYVDDLTDEQQDQIDYMLDAFDKVGQIVKDDNGVMLDYDFLTTDNELITAYGYLIGGGIDEFNKKYDFLNDTAVLVELDHISIIIDSINDIIKNQE